jgi:hypothetical protein
MVSPAVNGAGASIFAAGPKFPPPETSSSSSAVISHAPWFITFVIVTSPVTLNDIIVVQVFVRGIVQGFEKSIAFPA